MIFANYTLFMCQVEISIRNPNLDQKSKFGSEIESKFGSEIESKFGSEIEIWIKNRNLDWKSKFGLEIEIWIRNRNLD